MTLSQLTTIEQLEHFLDGSQICAYEVHDDKDKRYSWIQRTLEQFRYKHLGKRDKGIVSRYLIKISGYSRQQITRLIQQHTKTQKIIRKQKATRGFARCYTDADILLLASMDELHETPCGGIIKKLCERAYAQGDEDYERLRGISVSHVYNLRRSVLYQKKRRYFTKTKSKKSSIGDRRKPSPNQQPGYLRVDTVHQGDQDKQKGVYHVNLVDEVTQFEICFAVEKISERYLVPELERAMAELPFKISGFHSDNGSEYINKSVAALLSKLHIEFTKSRSRQSNDNALVESKNASVVRKHFGYSHIPQHWANELNAQIQQPLYRYLNFHRPCFFPFTITDDKGKEKKKYLYKNLLTPYEKFISLPEYEKYLKAGVAAEALQRYANMLSDQEAAQQLREAKQGVFEKIFKQRA